MSRVIGNIRNILYNMHIRPKRASITPKRNRSSSGEKKFSWDRIKQSDKLLFVETFWKSGNYSVGEPFMAPVGQYVFAEMWSKSGQCTAGSHEWLPYSWIWAFLIILKGCRNCQLSIVNCQFGEAAKQQFLAQICPQSKSPGWLGRGMSVYRTKLVKVVGSRSGIP